MHWKLTKIETTYQRYFDVDLIEAGINVVQEVEFLRMCKWTTVLSRKFNRTVSTIVDLKKSVWNEGFK